MGESFLTSGRMQHRQTQNSGLDRTIGKKRASVPRRFQNFPLPCTDLCAPVLACTFSAAFGLLCLLDRALSDGFNSRILDCLCCRLKVKRFHFRKVSLRNACQHASLQKMDALTCSLSFDALSLISCDAESKSSNSRGADILVPTCLRTSM